MDSKKIHSILVAITVSIVLIVETGIQWLPANPLLKTGIARCLEIIFILMVFRRSESGLIAIGLSRAQMISGFKSGLVWSAGFGILAVMAGAVLFFSGLNPFHLLHVRLPASKTDLVLFFIIGGLIAPVAEEIFFRGVIYAYIKGLLAEKMRTWSIPAAVAVSTWLFVAAHQGNSVIPLPQLVGGIVFCLSYESGKSLISPMIIHSLGNLTLFSISLF